MDIVGSILNCMEKPPAKKQNKDESAMLKKIAETEKKNLEKFRKKIEDRIDQFISDAALQKMEFDPMNRVKRSIIHDVAEVAGIVAYSFGEEEIDRHVILFKKQYLPSDDEIAALRKGQAWTPEIKTNTKPFNAESTTCHSNEHPKTNYQFKYQHIVDWTVDKELAVKTTAKSSYGFVPSTNKRDARSIEQTLADIQARKKLKEKAKLDDV